MKAARVHEYGGPELLRIDRDVEEPEPGPGEVLVRIRATSVNPIDCRMRAGYGRSLAKLQGRTFPFIFGRDCAGVVEAVGEGAGRFAVGDAVMGAPAPTAAGTYAELISMPEGELAPKPAGLAFDEAASLPYVTVTTWAALVDAAGLGPDDSAGKRVFITAGAGGVGTFAIQLLRSWGCEVTTSARPRHHDQLRELGAARILDRTSEDFGELLSSLRDFDVVFDNVGDSPPGREAEMVRILKTDGSAQFVTIVHPTIAYLDEAGGAEGFARVAEEKKRREQAFSALGGYHWSVARANGPAVQHVAEAAAAGRILPVIERRFPFEAIAAAHEALETGPTAGKLVIELD